jgi:hypothetical protein
MKRKPATPRKTLSGAERTAIARKTRGAAAAIGARGQETAFREVAAMIEAARARAYQAVNTELIELYWRVGQYISHKVESAEWGDAVIDELARFIKREHPDIRGFARRNLFRMRKFYET